MKKIIAVWGMSLYIIISAMEYNPGSALTPQMKNHRWDLLLQTLTDRINCWHKRSAAQVQLDRYKKMEQKAEKGNE